MSDEVQNLLQENSRVLHRQVSSTQVTQEEEEDDDEEVLGLHERGETSVALEPMKSKEEIQKIVVAKLIQAKGSTHKIDGGKAYPSYPDQVAYPKGYNTPKFKGFNGLEKPY